MSIDVENCYFKAVLIHQLVDSGLFKFGDYQLKSGIKSNYYVDLREATMYPEMFKNVVSLIKEEVNTILNTKKEEKFAIVGVPYGVVPIASAVAYDCNLAYYPVRKEVKDYGSKPDLKSHCEFKYIIVEDVMSSGSSIVETMQKMGDKQVTDVIVVVNRELGGEDKLKQDYPNINLHTILKASDIIDIVNGKL